jgi:hypothetical protein
VNAVVAAASLIWSGMVLAISFLEAPLKFRAPGVTTAIGVGIGRLVFGALNVAEAALAVIGIVAAVVGGVPFAAATAGAVAVGVLVVQVVLIRPRLRVRSDAVIAGADPPRSSLHWWYVGGECVKLAALLTAGTVLLAA